MSTTVLLVRHGQTESNITGYFMGWSNEDISQLGCAQAHNLSSRLASFPISSIYTSPLKRTVSTARILAEPHKLEPEAMDDLISRLSSIKALDAVEETEGDHGLEEPALSIRVVLAGGREAGLDIGTKIEEKNRYYARARDGQTVFMIGQFNYKKLNLTLQDLKAVEDQEDTEEPATSG